MKLFCLLLTILRVNFVFSFRFTYNYQFLRAIKEKSSFLQYHKLLCAENNDGIEMTDTNYDVKNSFVKGQLVKALVVQFGPMGASVDIDDGKARGLIPQKEISMFREKRNGEDVVLDEVLDAYVEKVREDGRINISLRPEKKSRMESVREMILEALEGSPTGDIPVGDKSEPDDINAYFHGLSKRDFKTAVGYLYKTGYLLPGSFSTTLIPEEERDLAKIEAIKGKSNLPKFSNDACSIFVGNLPQNANEINFKFAITKILGEERVKDVRLVKDNEGVNKGFGYIEVTSEEIVEDCIAELTGRQFIGRKLRVDYADPTKKMKKVSSNPSGKKTWEKVDKRAGRKDIEHWEDLLGDGLIGGVENNGRKKSWSSEAIEDLKSLNRGKNRRNEGKNGKFDRPRKSNIITRNNRKTQKSTSTLYFGNLSYRITDEILKSEIEKFVGEECVASVRLGTEQDTGNPKGFAFVDISKRELAEKIYDEMHEHEVMGRKLNIDDRT